MVFCMEYDLHVHVRAHVHDDDVMTIKRNQAFQTFCLYIQDSILFVLEYYLNFRDLRDLHDLHDQSVIISVFP